MEGYHIYMFYNILHTFRFDLILFPRDAKTPVGSFCQVFRSVYHLLSIYGHNATMDIQFCEICRFGT